MTATARRKPARATVATLSALGAERLAELLLLAASRDNIDLKRVLTLLFARDAEDMTEEVDRQRQRLRTGRLRPAHVEAMTAER